MARIMVIEDDDELAQELAEILAVLGHEVPARASSGEECLKLVVEAAPDLVLMDVQIKGALDGIETARRLKQLVDMPVVYLTGFSDSATLKRARTTDAYGFLVKPFRVSEINSTIELALFKHHTEAGIRRRERWFSTTLRAIADAVIAVDIEQRIVFANHVAEALVEAEAGTLSGRALGDVFQLRNPNTREELDLVGRVLTYREPLLLPTGAVLVRAGGDLPVEASVAPIVDDAGVLLGAVVVFRDTREREALLERISTSDRLASLGTLAAGVAHEINNPLTYVMANAAMVSRELSRIESELGEVTNGCTAAVLASSTGQLSRLRDDVTEIEEGAERIRRIVADLRVFARPDSGHTEGDLAAALRWALRVTKTLFNGRAEVEVELASLPTVRGDMTRLGQVFINLLVNAAQAIPEGNAEHERVVVSTRVLEGDRVEVSIRDTGSGMTPEVMRKIFEPFYTTKPVGSGTGLGLSVCKGIVDAVGGELLVESVPNVGSTFRVVLPVASPTTRPVPPLRKTPTPRGRVLVVDDDEIVAKSIGRMLSEQHDVRVVTDARQALLLLRDETFDVVVSDLLMPQMSGSQLHDEVSRLRPEVASRFVFVSGAFTAEASAFLERVPNPRLPKPPSLGELTRAVRTVLLEGTHRSGCHPIERESLRQASNDD